MPFPLLVRRLTGESVTLSDIPDNASVLVLKKMIQKACGAAISTQVLIYDGAPMQDDELLMERNIGQETAIMMIEKKPQTKTQADVPSASDDSILPPIQPDTAGAAAASAVKGPSLGSIELRFRTLNGKTTAMTVPLHDSFKNIKFTLLQQRCAINAIYIRLIYAGCLVHDADTPNDLNLAPRATLHIVRRSDDSIKEEVISRAALRANCRWCHTAGAPIDLRPRCKTCGSEAVRLLDGVRIRVGVSKWTDLENCKAMCYSNVCAGGARKRQDVAWGFLCKARIDGHVCQSRKPQPRNRIMLATYNASGDTRGLVEVLNELFGYAHAAGMEC